MPRDVFAWASGWLEKQFEQSATQCVTLRRASSSVPLRAQIGKTDFEVDADGLLTKWESRDYLIRASEYALDDVPTVPTPGDQIIEGDLSSGVVFEVMAPQGHDVWQWSDNYRRTYRIHTKYVGPITSAF